MRVPLIIAMVAIVGACGKTSAVEAPNGPIACTAIAVAGVNVKVLDSLTGVPLAFRDLWARVTDGTYKDSVLISQTSATSAPYQFGLAYERPGHYELTVRALGYKAWTKSNVTVTADICHVNPVSITARLQK